MRPALVRLVDLGLDQDFAQSMTFAQGVIGSLTVDWADHPAAEVDYVRTRNWWVVAEALQAPADVLHIMGHGDNTPEEVSFSSDDGASVFRLDDMASHFASQDGGGIQASAVIADACSSSTGAFKRAVRDCLPGPLTYIGTKRAVGWHEATTWAAGFYAAYFRTKGRGVTPENRALDAARRADRSYLATVDRPSPFTAGRLVPSRWARQNFT